MNNTLIKVLAAVSLLLSIVLAIEWLIIRNPETQSVNIDGSTQTLDLTEDLPNYAAKIKALEYYAQIVERPLFIQSRRPIVEDDTTEEVVHQLGEIKDFELQGIYTVNGEMTALFNKKRAGKSFLKKKRDEDVAGWQIKQIMPDRVVLQSQGQQQTVMLRKPKPKVNKAQVNTKPRPRTRQTLDLKASN